jgi:hypothetical protein
VAAVHRPGGEDQTRIILSETCGAKTLAMPSHAR